MDSLKALADPTRRRIVELLTLREMSAGEIARQFKLSAPAISQHLKVLSAAHLVQMRAEAQRRIYEIDPDGFVELDAWLINIRQFWRGRLDAPIERRLIKRTRNEAGN